VLRAQVTSRMDARTICVSVQSLHEYICEGRTRSTSPVAGVWTVFGCDTCFYTWRSTEPAENTDPDKYPPIFRLNPEDLAKLPEVPSIPPRRQRTD
jgi:hypothetical protein